MKNTDDKSNAQHPPFVQPKPLGKAEDRATRLLQYTRRPLKEFAQIDVHTNRSGSIGEFYDDDGDAINSGRTHEMMHAAAVRILIAADVDTDTARRLIAKALDALESILAVMAKPALPEFAEPGPAQALSRMRDALFAKVPLTPEEQRDLAALDASIAALARAANEIPF